MRSFVYWYEYTDFTLTLIFLKTPVYELSSQEFAVVSIYQLKLRWGIAGISNPTDLEKSLIASLKQQ